MAGKPYVYFTTIGAAIAYLARDQQRFYNYDSLTGLNQGIGHGQVAMNEGWYLESSTLKLFVRSLDDPAGHSWQIPTLNYAFDIAARDWLWIEGFEMRFYGATTLGCGVCTTNASHVVIRRNKIHNLQLGIFVNWNGSDSQGNDTRIEFNEVYDPPVNEWPWKAVDGSTMEGTAIVVRGHIGRSCVATNCITSRTVSTPAHRPRWRIPPAFDADIYDNYIHHIGDDALEPEGACINHRFRNNKVDAAFVGISLAPVTQGPTWVLRSTFTNYTGRAFKWDRASDGIVLVYHNTSWGDTGNIDAMDMISAVDNAVLRNNFSRAAAMGSTRSRPVRRGTTGTMTTGTLRAPSRVFKWENVPYNTLADLCARTGLECQGYENSPGLATRVAAISRFYHRAPMWITGPSFRASTTTLPAAPRMSVPFDTASGPTICGDLGVSGATLSYVDGWASSAGNGNYSFTVPYGWSGTVTPTKAGYTFTPPSLMYTNVLGESDCPRITLRPRLPM